MGNMDLTAWLNNIDGRLTYVTRDTVNERIPTALCILGICKVVVGIERSTGNMNGCDIKYYVNLIQTCSYSFQCHVNIA